MPEQYPEQKPEPEQDTEPEFVSIDPSQLPEDVLAGIRNVVIREFVRDRALSSIAAVAHTKPGSEEEKEERLRLAEWLRSLTTRELRELAVFAMAALVHEHRAYHRRRSPLEWFRSTFMHPLSWALTVVVVGTIIGAWVFT